MKKYLVWLAALSFIACNSSKETTTTEVREPVSQIIEYTPAPGQFINEGEKSGGYYEDDLGGGFHNVDTPAKACEYVVTRFASNNWVSLGGWGGYIIAAFAEPVPNTGNYDLYVAGNAFDTSSEPGVVWVMQDANNDGVANDTWYELKGSEYNNAKTIRNYRITYTRPAADNQPVAWNDNQGGSGTIDRMPEHAQASYYPAWISSATLQFEGTRLPDNVKMVGELYTSQPFEWGYADNFSAVDRKGMINRFRISDAVTADGHPANLQQIDFIKVQTGVNVTAPLIGEISTEVTGIGCYRTIIKNN